MNAAARSRAERIMCLSSSPQRAGVGVRGGDAGLKMTQEIIQPKRLSELSDQARSGVLSQSLEKVIVRCENDGDLGPRGILLHQSQNSDAASPEQFSIQDHDVRDTMTQTREAFDPIRSSLYLVATARQVATSNFEESGIAISNQHVHLVILSRIVSQIGSARTDNPSS